MPGKKVFSGALSLLMPFLPFSSFAHLQRADIDGRNYIIEIDEKKKLIQIEAKEKVKGKQAHKASLESFLQHQRTELESNLEDLDYSTIQLVRSAAKESKSAARALNKLVSWLDLKQSKIPWWTFLFYGLQARFFAWESIKPIRKEAAAYLKTTEHGWTESSVETYSTLIYLNRSVENASSYMREITESTEPELPWSNVKLSDLEKRTKQTLRYWDLKKGEKMLKEIQEIIKEDIRKDLDSREATKKFEQIKKGILHVKINPEKIISRYRFVLENPKIFFSQTYEVPLFLTAPASPSLETHPIKTSLELKIAKSCISSNNYNLRIEILSEDWNKQKKWYETKVHDWPQTAIYALYPSDVEIKKPSESANLAFSKHNKMQSIFKELIPLPRGRKTTLEAEIPPFAIDETLSRVAKGNITRIRNITNYLAKKIAAAENKRDSIAKEVVLEKLQDYVGVEIPIYPSPKQETARFISIPFENVSQKDFFLVMHLGARDWEDSSRGRLEDLVIRISNEEMPAEIKTHEKIWIIPENYVEKQEEKVKITRFISGTKTLDPYNKQAEWAMVEILGKRYFFADKEFARYCKECFPVYLSEKTRFEFVENPNKSDLSNPLEGIYFTDKDLRDLLPQEKKENNEKQKCPENPEKISVSWLSSHWKDYAGKCIKTSGYLVDRLITEDKRTFILFLDSEKALPRRNWWSDSSPYISCYAKNKDITQLEKIYRRCDNQRIGIKGRINSAKDEKYVDVEEITPCF